MNRVITFLVVVLSVVGCANRSWYHPSKSQDQFNQDRYSCTQQAAQTYPVLIQQQSYGVARTTPSQTTCQTTFGQLSCTTTPGTYTPPQTISVDVNEGNRSGAFNSCMNSLGWSLLNKEQAVAAQIQAGSRVSTAKIQLDDLAKTELESCSKDEFKIISVKSPCRVDDITLDQLADVSIITAREKQVFLALYSEKKVFLKQRADIYRSAGDPVAIRLADLTERNLRQVEMNSLSLYEGKITWGEFNKVRKQISSSTADEFALITQKK